MAPRNNNKAMAKLWAEETAAANEWETRERYKGHVVADLRKTFDKLCDPKDWKVPISAWVPWQMVDIAKVAVEFFTAAELKVVGGPEPITGRLLCESIGYRAGPAGDH